MVPQWFGFASVSIFCTTFIPGRFILILVFLLKSAKYLTIELQTTQIQL